MERATEDFMVRASDEIELVDEDLKESAVRVDAGEAAAIGTLTFMRFGVPPMPEPNCFG